MTDDLIVVRSYGRASRVRALDEGHIDGFGWVCVTSYGSSRPREHGRLARLLQTLLMPVRLTRLRLIADLIPSPGMRARADTLLSNQEQHIAMLREQHGLLGAAWIHFATWLMLAWLFCAGLAAAVMRLFSVSKRG
jgi:hypothetical protein